MAKGRRIVVKLGTSTLTHSSGRLNYQKMEKIVRTLADIQGAGNDVIVVTSAAISVGTAKMGLPERPKELKYKMAIAAVGQARLMHIYDTLFSEYSRTVAQILLTGDNVEDEADSKYLSNTFQALLSMGVIPIVNENDSVSSVEIVRNRWLAYVSAGGGVNDDAEKLDRLSAIVAKFCHADLLILLSDIEGLYDADPRKYPGANLIHEVNEVTPEIIDMAGGAGSSRGTGGMMTKLAAAKIAIDNGFDMVITNNDNIDNLYDIVDGKQVGTLFRRREKC